MISWECYENTCKWFYMKYIGKYLSGEILLTRECMYGMHSMSLNTETPILLEIPKQYIYI
jgi:hypothetical protein